MNVNISGSGMPMANWQNTGHVKVKEKVCTKCPEKGPQPIENFRKSPSMKDGRESCCKACRKKYEDAKYAQKKEEREKYGFI